MKEDLLRYQAKICSQNGEDGVLLEILARLRIDRGRCAEIGASLVNGNLECNTAILLNNGWEGRIFDKEPIVHPWVTQAHVTTENVAGLLPPDLDVLSIDVDGMDYWLWKAVEQVPSVVIIEYNSHIPALPAVSVPYDPDFCWDGSDYFGASLGAMVELGERKGYGLAAVVHSVNAFFVRGWECCRWKDLRTVLRHPSDFTRKYVEV